MSLAMRRASVLDGMPKMGAWIASIEDVTASRAFATDYQNISGRPKLCIVSVFCADNDGGADAWARACVSSAVLASCIATSTDRVANAGFFTEAVETPKSAFFSLVFIVPAGFHYYLAASVGGTNAVAINAFWEVTL